MRARQGRRGRTWSKRFLRSVVPSVLSGTCGDVKDSQSRVNLRPWARTVEGPRPVLCLHLSSQALLVDVTLEGVGVGRANPGDEREAREEPATLSLRSLQTRPGREATGSEGETSPGPMTSAHTGLGGPGQPAPAAWNLKGPVQSAGCSGGCPSSDVAAASVCVISAADETGRRAVPLASRARVQRVAAWLGPLHRSLRGGHPGPADPLSLRNPPSCSSFPPPPPRFHHEQP